jgi:hypothetical protein
MNPYKILKPFRRFQFPLRETWDHGQFNAMIRELGYSRHICSVDFAKDKVLKKRVLSVD